MSKPDAMNACVLHAVGDLRFEQVSMPQRKPGEVLLKIRASGICGSDLPRVFERGTYHFPTIPGHEFAGEIAEADDPDLVGRRAAVFPLLPCMRCEACRAEEYAQCAHYNYFGSRCDGGFAEYLCVPEWNLVCVPDGVGFEEAAMTEPAAVARHAVLTGGVKPGDAVAIFGAGPIGMMLAQWARSFGASQVMLSDIDPYKVEFAGKMGFEAMNSRKNDAVEFIRQATGGRGADVCIEGAGASQAWEQCLGAAAAFGRVVLMGNPSGDMKLTQKGYWEILRKQLTLKGTWNSSYGSRSNDWKAALEAMSEGILNLKPLVSHRFPLSQCQEAFDVMRRRDGWVSKVLFVMD
jgi:L-iditol 2-dehydrogenase